MEKKEKVRALIKEALQAKDLEFNQYLDRALKQIDDRLSTLVKLDWRPSSIVKEYRKQAEEIRREFYKIILARM